MINCSIGPLQNVQVYKALSGYTFAEFSISLEAYQSLDKLTITLGDVPQEYKIVGAETYPDTSNSAFLVKLLAILDDHVSWMDHYPISVYNGNLTDQLKNLGLSSDLDYKVSFTLLDKTKGQVAIALANLGKSVHFVDFNTKQVLKYATLYKAEPIVVNSVFKVLKSRTQLVGSIGWSDVINMDVPGQISGLVSYGLPTNLSQLNVNYLIANLNELTTLYSELQVFVTSTEIPLGSTIVSPMSNDKRVVVAVTEFWNTTGCSRQYYCI